MQAAEDAASAAAEAAEAAQVLLEQWREAKAAADDAAELEELDDEAQGPSPEEPAYRAAQAQPQVRQDRQLDPLASAVLTWCNDGCNRNI